MAGWGLRPDPNIALNILTLIMSLRKSLFQIPVEAVFVSELSLNFHHVSEKIFVSDSC